MGAVKIRESDRLFSRCVRERSGWVCERCGAQHQEGSQGLHCSHFHGRGKWALRFDPNNCFALCYGCHSYVGGHPTEHLAFATGKLGQGMIDLLQEKATDSKLGRLAKREEPEIRKHYRAALATMKQARADGHTGRLEFDGWI